jgi:phospholipase A-2-activating protein
VRGQGPSGKDVAGKWDCEKVLSGHSAAVWGVAIFEEGPREGCYITGWSNSASIAAMATAHHRFPCQTGSADRLIKLWSPEAILINDFPVQADCVRSLAVFPGGNAFAAALNDGYVDERDLTARLSILTQVPCLGYDRTVRILDTDGSTLSVLRGHGDYVYHVAIDDTDGTLLSCGEDHTVRVWRGRPRLKTARQKRTDLNFPRFRRPTG